VFIFQTKSYKFEVEILAHKKAIKPLSFALGLHQLKNILFIIIAILHETSGIFIVTIVCNSRIL